MWLRGGGGHRDTADGLGEVSKLELAKVDVVSSNKLVGMVALALIDGVGTITSGIVVDEGISGVVVVELPGEGMLVEVSRAASVAETSNNEDC